MRLGGTQTKIEEVGDHSLMLWVRREIERLHAVHIRHGLKSLDDLAVAPGARRGRLEGDIHQGRWRHVLGGIVVLRGPRGFAVRRRELYSTAQ